MKIWQCYNNLPAQKWYYTDDNRIALEGQGKSGFQYRHDQLEARCLDDLPNFLSIGQCLDLTNGVLTNGNQVQTWQCTDNNQNQVWTL
jgi:hypothetical protein